MSRRAAAFTQADVKRAALGAISAGLTPQRLEIDGNGKIVIIVAGEDHAGEPHGRPEDWEKRLRGATGWEK